MHLRNALSKEVKSRQGYNIHEFKSNGLLKTFIKKSFTSNMFTGLLTSGLNCINFKNLTFLTFVIYSDFRAI